MLRAWLLVAALAVTAAPVAGSARAAERPLRTAVYPLTYLAGADGATELQRIRSAGASLVRLAASWKSVAPATPPAGFAAADPTDPAYDWSGLDAEIQAAVAAGLQPIVDVVDAPTWAQADAGVSHPNAAQLGLFAHAIAAHYDGTTPGAPRVRYWQLWNEPNLNTNIQPQFQGTQPVSPGIYRGMLNAFARAVKSVSAANVVVVGGLAPYGITEKGQPVNGVLSVAPLTFMRDLLCVSAGPRPHATCRTKVEFDDFSVHPYTWGGPTHKAYSPDDVAIGNLPGVQALLAAAWRLHRVAAPSRPALWVTEFSWDTNPPDPKALPIAIQARWTAEALYHMWADGVAVVTWFLLRDEPLTEPFQSGLYFAGATVAQDTPKPTLTAFRFPFVAYPQRKGVYVWGRTPDSAAHGVQIERQVGSGWQPLALLRAGPNGIFQRLLPLAARTGSLRARLVGGADASLPFGLASVPDRRISPFGG